MARHGRMRRVVRWAATAAAVSLLVAWGGSLLGSANYHDEAGRSGVGLAWGRLYFAINVGQPPCPAGWSVCAYDHFGPRMYWLPDFGRANPGVWLVPIWIPWTPAAALAVWLWVSDTRAARRSRTYLCPNCSYDRRGPASPTSPCPECGTPAPS